MPKYTGDKIISFRCDPDMNHKLTTYCKNSGQQKSRFIRNAIKQYLKTQGSLNNSVLQYKYSPAIFYGDNI